MRIPEDKTESIDGHELGLKRPLYADVFMRRRTIAGTSICNPIGSSHSVENRLYLFVVLFGGIQMVAQILLIQVGLPKLLGVENALDPMDRPWSTGFFKEVQGRSGLEAPTEMVNRS